MAVVSKALGAVYFDITKVGSSTFKEALWELDHGAPFKGRGLARIRNNLHWRLAKRHIVAARNIHEQPGYRNQIFDIAEVPTGFATFTIVRDPIARLKSAWRDKIHINQFRWRGELMDIENEGLPPDPTFAEFIDHFETYRMVSRPVRVHTTSYGWHLGPDLGFFDDVFQLEEPAPITEYFSQKLGRPFKLGHENKDTRAPRNDQITPAHIDRIAEITAPDYMLLGGLYDMDKSLAKLRAG